jgi:hypothetical protein
VTISYSCARVGLCWTVLGWGYASVSIRGLLFSSGLFLGSIASVRLVFVLRPGSASPVAGSLRSRSGFFRGVKGEVSQDVGFYP